MPDVDIDRVLFVNTLVTMTVLMDPVGNIPIFLGLSRNLGPPARRHAARTASLVAGMVILVFAFFGDLILVALGIDLPALQASGGLLLLIVALELLHPFDEEAPAAGGETRNIALVPLGTPLLAGPGAIATVMVYMRQADGAGARISVVGALLVALVVVYLSLRFVDVLAKVLSPDVVQVISRVMGFLLASIAVQLVAKAVAQWVRDGVG